MRTKGSAGLALVVTGILGGMWGAASVLAAGSAPPARQARRVRVLYTAAVPSPPPHGKRLSLWIPYPPTDSWQEISDVRVVAPLPYEVRREAAYGNRFVFLTASPPRPLTVHLRFTVLRRSRAWDDRGSRPATREELRRALRPDRLGPIGGPIGELARRVTAGRTTARERARAIYEFVTTSLRYDKSGHGWGRGDAVWACDRRRGNCTDFHALLIAMARAVGIPARFDIGFPLPRDASRGSVPGYHCWAELYVEGAGWLPVDSSEAHLHPELRDYFFGHLDANRVRLSSGRDLTLDPPQRGDPINYFVYPYAEIDGRPLRGVRFSFRFRELPVGAARGTPGTRPAVHLRPGAPG